MSQYQVCPFRREMCGPSRKIKLPDGIASTTAADTNQEMLITASGHNKSSDFIFG